MRQQTRQIVSQAKISKGRIKFIYSDDLQSLMAEGQAEVRRVSHVEPSNAANWTADMSPVNGPVLGPFPTRGEALAAEVDWLRQNLLS